MTSAWTAYVDESIRPIAGVYLLAAACVADVEIAEVRATAAQLAPPQQRFHWRDEKPPSRMKAVGLVGGLPALHLVVVGAPIDPRRQERARRHCLRRLLYELDEAGVSLVRMESRGRRLDTLDLQAVNVMRIQRVIGSALMVDHTQPGSEPLLWLPDIVAGAVGGQLDGKDSYAEELSGLIIRYEVDLR